MDVHTRLMSRYKQVPEWWFISILVVNIALTIFACEYYIDQLQLPWWGVLLACALAIFFTLPIGIITATTNQTPGLNIITEYIMGYLYPGRPVANMCFMVYGYISMTQALTFLQDFKLGHYIKIPPRTMSMAQVVGTLIAAIVYLGTAWWLMDSVANICDKQLLSAGLVANWDVYITNSTRRDFGNYAQVCLDLFGDKLKHYITLNEPRSFSQDGYSR